jgi:glycosyltransferase involved in cell wall biosynthesis
MKIAMLGLKGIPATYGGIERHVEELSAQLALRGHDVTVYCRSHYTGPVRECRGVALRTLPSLNTKRLDTLTHTALAACHTLLRPYDVVHFHSIGASTLSFLPRAALWRSCRVVCTVHALDWQRRKWGPVARWCLRRGEWTAATFPHRLIAVSREMADRFRARGCDARYIPNGVAPPEPGDMADLAPLGVRAPGFILWLGRMVPEKRVEILLRAFRRLPTERQLLIGGELDPRDAYTRLLLADASGDARILFTGGLYGRAKAAALRHAALVVLPSELEGFPIVLLEAMRYGRPTLASDIAANLEAVRPDHNGFTFPVGNADALRDRLQWMLDHPAECAEAGRRAQLDSAAYDWARIAGETEEVYGVAETASARY